jgi:hypothetical protein
VDNNIQPDGSWRDPTAQMAIDIGQGKVNPSGAGYAAVEQAHQTYGSDHINGLWGHHANAPAPASRNDWWLNSSSSAGYRPFPQPSASAAMPAPAGYDADYQRAADDDARPVMQQAAPRAGGDWGLIRDICIGAGIGIVAALVVDFLRR